MTHQDPFKASFDFTRPNDTIAYATGDVVNSVTSGGTAFELVQVGAGLGLNRPEIISITNFSITCNNPGSIPADDTIAFNLILFPEIPSSELNDNETLNLTFEEAKNMLILTTIVPSNKSVQSFVNGFKTFFLPDSSVRRSIQLKKPKDPADPDQNSLYGIITLWSQTNDVTLFAFDANTNFHADIEGVRVGGIN